MQRLTTTCGPAQDEPAEPEPYKQPEPEPQPQPEPPQEEEAEEEEDDDGERMMYYEIELDVPADEPVQLSTLRELYAAGEVVEITR